MDSFKKTTRFLFGGPTIAERLRKVFTPCVRFNGVRKVSIKVFDKKSLVGDATDSIDRVKQLLETFFNSLHATAGLPTAVAQNLQTFSFEVLFFKRAATDQERRGFGMLDFPVYIESTENQNPLTEGAGEGLLIEHRIPEQTQVRLIKSPTETETVRIHSYKEVKDLIKDPNQKILGVGIPGTYFAPVSQTRCRKIGIIKMNLVIKNLVPALREQKFILVLKHEIGHMFGMEHEDNTLMDTNYKDLSLHPDYTVNQIRVLDQVLTSLSQ